MKSRLKNIVNALLTEKGGKKSLLDQDTYYFISPTFMIKDKNTGYKYTVAKVKTDPKVCLQVYRYDLDANPEYFEIDWRDFRKNYETV